MSYVELWVTSNFSFLRGASHPEELVEAAAAFGQKVIALTDRNTMAGIVRAHSAAKKAGVRLIPACRLDLEDGPSVLAYPVNRKGYSRLCALLTLGNMRTEKGKCSLFMADVFAYKTDIKFVIIPPDTLNRAFDFEPGFYAAVRKLQQALGAHCYLAICRHYGGDDTKQLYRLRKLSERYYIPLIATNNVHYHTPERRELQDVLTCIREKCTIATAGFLLHPNAERHMKSPKEMERLFREYPDAIEEAQRLADACRFSLDQLEYLYPHESLVEGRTPQEQLEYLVGEGVAARFPDGRVPVHVRDSIAHELKIIGELNYAEYFLTVYDICRYAKDHQILYQGRGSAANSACCYYLGITNVDPSKFELLFERFISAARNEKPDIDVDFEHERREEVMQYIYEKYGRDRAAIVATVTQVHQKTAIRDVGRVMGLSQDNLDRMSEMVAYGSSEWIGDRLQQNGFNTHEPLLKKILELTGQYLGFPRQLGQHTGGFIITDGKLTDLCPIFNARMEHRTNIEWNKDDIESLGFLKIDVLALGMLTAIRKAFDLLKNHYDRDCTLWNIPQDDPKVYEMISAADTIGVFQIESRAQQSMLPRMQPKCFFDLVIEVAIVRPGPIVGDMVHPYLRRRNGEEAVEYPSPELEQILKRTLGVPLFQEQAMKIVMVAAGFTAAEADELRRGMATFKLTGVVSKFRDKVVAGMIRNGYSKEYALRLFKQLEGFGSYGFPESHAASFAHLVYISSWIKCYYPDVFVVAILNSLPMGFYAPAQLIADAIKHGVIFLPVDVNHSMWDYTIECYKGKYAVRVGFRQISGIKHEEVLLLVAHRLHPYATVQAIQDCGITVKTLEQLADADAFGSLGMDRRTALWEVAGLNDNGTIRTTGKVKKITHQYSLFDVLPEDAEKVSLPRITPAEDVIHDYRTVAFSLKAHPLSFIRANLNQLQCWSAEALLKGGNGDYVRAAGLVLVKQRPGTAKGVCFITLEDETGQVNLIVWPTVFAHFQKEILTARLLFVEGHLQVANNVRHVIVQACYDASRMLRQLIQQEAGEKEVFNTGRNFK